MPKAITVDNGTQFDSEAFREFCDRIGTKIHFASVRHPESNGLVERANGPAQGNLRYVVVAVEYFSKWIEAKPLATITSVTVQKFF